MCSEGGLRARVSLRTNPSSDASFTHSLLLIIVVGATDVCLADHATIRTLLPPRSGISVLTFGHPSARWISLGAHAVARGKRGHACVLSPHLSSYPCARLCFLLLPQARKLSIVHRSSSLRIVTTQSKRTLILLPHVFFGGRCGSVAKRARTLHSLAFVI
jgi:hypothetical protein